MSQVCDPAAKAHGGDALNSGVMPKMPAMRLLAARRVSNFLHLRGRKCAAFEFDCFTSLCPFHDLEMVFFLISINKAGALILSSAARSCSSRTRKIPGPMREQPVSQKKHLTSF